MSNNILKELKEYYKDLRQKELKKFNLNYDTRLSISILKRSLHSDYSKLQNEYEYERPQIKIEYEI